MEYAYDTSMIAHISGQFQKVSIIIFNACLQFAIVFGVDKKFPID
jgi:hypothetical protein